MGKAGEAPTILKRKKVIAEAGHHGGAWKVAYADFVTAMMAFFLLMWLLNATTEQQRKGIADYFSPEIPIARVSGGGDGAFGGDSPSTMTAMAEDGEMTANGSMGESTFPQYDGSEGTAAAEAAETASLQEMEDVLLGRGGESLVSDQAMRHVVTRITDEGLIIEIFALPAAPLWRPGTEVPMPVTEELVAMIARVSALVTNGVAVAGHVPTPPVVVADSPVWALSAGRAERVRTMLEGAGLQPSRAARVTGHADRAPAVADPGAVRNDRIEVTLLRSDA